MLRGIECDILPDGTLDLPDDVLAELDWVQASVHAGQRATRDAMTKRVIEALRHPSVSCLSHPKGRIINHRPENALDLERAFEVALEEGKAVEVNGLPDRLDLRDVHVRLAVESGVPIVCSTDAHSTRGLGNMQLVGRDGAARRRNGRRRRQYARARGATASVARTAVVVVLDVAGRIARPGAVGDRRLRRSAPRRRRRRRRFDSGRSPSGRVVAALERADTEACGAATWRKLMARLYAPCPLVDHSARSNQCVCRSASTTPRVGVRRVEDVPLEVAADGDVGERDVR